MFWVDASSVESITVSLKSIYGMPATQGLGVDDSVESVLQWLSHIQEEWCIVFDNADDPCKGNWKLDLAKLAGGPKFNIL